MQYQHLLELLQSNLATMSLWIGLVTVLFFAIGRFNEPRKDLEGLDPPIYVRNFTTRFRYNFAALTYAGLYSVFFMILICAGSIPALQEFLKDSIGSVPGMGNESVGTPQWAALAITAALPTLPPVARFDQRLREALQNFASIPVKAQSIADEILTDIRSQQGGSDLQEPETFEKLDTLVAGLGGLKRRRAAQAYSGFFARNNATLEVIRKKAAGLPKLQEIPEDQVQFYAAEWERMNKRLSRLAVCALLTVEVDEYSVRKTLRDDFAMSGIQVGEWRFRSTQILFAVMIVIAVTSVAAVGTTYFGLSAMDNSKVTLDLMLKLVGRFLVAGVLWVPVFLLPLLFCAGVQMYLIDLEHFGEKPEADTRAFFFLVTAFGAVVSAMLPVTAIGVIVTALMHESPELAQTLPWAGPPALFAIMFALLSRRQLFDSSALNAGADFIMHGAAAAGSGWCAAKLSIFFGLQPQLHRIPLELVPLVATVTSGLIGGTLGAVQCAISRMICRGRVALPTGGTGRAQTERRDHRKRRSVGLAIPLRRSRGKVPATG